MFWFVVILFSIILITELCVFSNNGDEIDLYILILSALVLSLAFVIRITS